MKEALVFLTNILKDKDIVVLGLSGGPDSMCLLDILRHLNKDITIIDANKRLITDQIKCVNINVGILNLQNEKFMNFAKKKIE